MEEATVADPPKVEPAETWPGLTDMVKLQKLLWAAERPLVILGGSRWTERSRREVVRFAERFDLPVATSSAARRSSRRPSELRRRRRDRAQPEASRPGEGADLLVLVGARMSEMPSSSYSLIDIPSPGRPSSTSIRTPRRSAASTSPPSASSPRRPPSARRSTPFSRRSRSAGARRRGRRARLRGLDGGCRRRCPRLPVRTGRPCPARAAAGRDHRLQRRRQLRHLVPPLLAPQRPRHPARADLRSMGYAFRPRSCQAPCIPTVP